MDEQRRDQRRERGKCIIHTLKQPLRFLVHRHRPHPHSDSRVAEGRAARRAAVKEEGKKERDKQDESM
jgi:hypothetical protein